MAERSLIEMLLADQSQQRQRGLMTHWQSGPAMPAGPIVDRAPMRPLGVDEYGRMRFALPGALHDSIQAWKNLVDTPLTLDTVTSPENVANAFDVAGAVTLGAGAMPTRGATLRAGASIPRAPFDLSGGGMGQRQGVYDLPPGSRAEYLGAAPDRTDFSFVRYTPKKESDRVAASVEAMRDPNNPARQQMFRDIEAGQKLGGSDWYNTEELRDWFVAELGEEQGHREWSQFMDYMGAASPGSKVDANIGNASEIRRRLLEGADELMPGSNQTYRQAGLVNPENEYYKALVAAEGLSEAGPLAKGRTKGYGHKTQNLQELVASRQAKGLWGADIEPGVAPASGNWTDNPKPKGFSHSLKGSNRNIAADLHFTRYMAMATKDPRWLGTQKDVSDTFARDTMAAFPAAKKYFGERTVNGKKVYTFNPKKAVGDGAVPIDAIAEYPTVWADLPEKGEYAAFEKFMGEIARELNMTPAQVQANLWMGAAKHTGVDDSSQGTFMELLRNRADKTAKKQGKTREEVIRGFIRDGGLLTFTGAGLLGGGMSAPGLLPPESQGAY